MGTSDASPVAAIGANQSGGLRGMSWTFLVILIAVLAITLGSLTLSLQQGTQRRIYEDQQYHALADLEPKGETSKVDEPKSLTDRRATVKSEVDSMQKTQDNLMSVFLLGSGAIVGLLTGKLIS
jgi:hypothetical protein